MEQPVLGGHRLLGGDGADTFLMGANDFDGAFAALSANRDVIQDFDRAQGDVIDLSALDAVVGGTDDAFTFIGTAAFNGVAGELRYELVNPGTAPQTRIFGDRDGNGTADMLIVLVGNHVVEATDFLL